MSYRNGTYIAFDGQGTTDPTQSDLKYLGLLRSWDKNKSFDFHYIDSHKKSASCDINSILSQLADFLQTFFQRLKIYESVPQQPLLIIAK